MTGREAMGRAAKRLAKAGCEDSAGVARVLLREALNASAAAMIAVLDSGMDSDVLDRYEAMVARACAGEPAQYIVGHWGFYGREFITDRRALIPRPETELLVEAVLAAIPVGQAVAVFDAGCGTGCIGITLKLERPMARVVLGDVSPDALSLTRENAALLGAGVEIIRADMRAALPGGSYDVIVSNPPYINSCDMRTLAPAVREHEPHLALHGGEDGLDYVRALAARAGDSLKPGGYLFIEVGYDQAGQTVEILKAAGMSAEARPDYAGIQRIVAARKGH